MLEKIKEILSNYTEVEAELITSESTLQGDLDLNSLDVMNMIMDFEEIFGIQIEDKDIPKFIKVGDIFKYIDAHRKQ